MRNGLSRRSNRIGRKVFNFSAWWASYLYNESDLALKFDSRSGSNLVDSVSGETAEMLTSCFLQGAASSAYVGGNLGALERSLDGNSYTYHSKCRFLVDVPTSGTVYVLALGGGTTAGSRGIAITSVNNRGRVFANDGTLSGSGYYTAAAALNSTFAGKGLMDFYVVVNFATKRITGGFYDSTGALIGTALNMDISAFTFNNNDNWQSIRFSSKCFCFDNFKKYTGVVSLENCKLDNYTTGLQIHLPNVLAGIDHSTNAVDFNHISVTSADITYQNLTSWIHDYGHALYSYENNYTVPNLITGELTTINRGAAFATKNFRVFAERYGNGICDMSDGKIRFTNAFFDRSNTTIWNDVARGNYKSVITLSGTGGTATITINGLAKVATFDTDLSTTAMNFAVANYEAYKAIGVIINASNENIISLSNYNTTITAATIVNATGDLAGTVVLYSYYDASDTKVFDVSEMNQRKLMAMLNNGYRGRFYVHFNSNSIEEFDRDYIIAIYLYTTDIKGKDSIAPMLYTGDEFAIAKSGSTYIYDDDNYGKLGILKTTKPMIILRFDDTRDTHLSVVLPWLQGLGVNKAITGCHSGQVGQIIEGINFLDWPGTLQLYNAGWEICCHNRTDVDYNTVENLPIVESEFELAIAEQEAQGMSCNHYIGNRHSSGGVHIPFQSHKAGFLTHFAGAMYGVPQYSASDQSVNKYSLSGIPVDIFPSSGFYLDQADPSVEIVNTKALIDLCKSEDRLLVIYMHSYVVAMTEIIQYIQANNIDFVTASEALANMSYQI